MKYSNNKLKNYWYYKKYRMSSGAENQDSSAQLHIPLRASLSLSLSSSPSASRSASPPSSSLASPSSPPSTSHSFPGESTPLPPFLLPPFQQPQLLRGVNRVSSSSR